MKYCLNINLLTIGPFYTLSINLIFIFLGFYWFQMSSKTFTAGLIIALAAISVIIFQQNSHKTELSEYQQWKQKFNINYGSEFEDLYRQTLFLKKKELIDLHNKNQTKRYTRGLNRFSALTQ